MSIFARKICRICMINTELVPIFEDNMYENELTILQKLETLNLNIQKNDGLPQNICVRCIKQLNSSFEFIKKSKNSEEIFRNQLLCNVTSPDDTLEQDVKFVLCEISPEQIYPLQHNVDIFIKTDEEAVCIKQEDNEIVKSIEQEHPEPHDHKLKVPIKNKKKSKDPKYLCATCQRVFLRTNLFNRHIHIHLKAGDMVAPPLTNSFNKLSAKHECPQCGMCFHKLYSYKLHNENFHISVDNANFKINGNEGLFFCAKCGREFHKKKSIERHMELHMMKNDPNLDTNSMKCSIPSCEKRFISERFLLWHEFRVHNRTCCPVCNKSYSKVEAIIHHLAVVHGKKRDHLCPLCGKRFSDNSCLKLHLECHNEERKTYTCTLCTKSYQTQSGLYVHTKNKHEKKKPFTCDFDGCGAKFFVPSLLKQHKMGHTGEKPYKCDYCPVRFRASKHRENHHRTHTGQKPFQCTYDNCDKAFAQSYDLTKHKTIHTGEKRHICHCGEAFRLSSSLKTHKKSHQAA